MKGNVKRVSKTSNQYKGKAGGCTEWSGGRGCDHGSTDGRGKSSYTHTHTHTVPA